MWGLMCILCAFYVRLMCRCCCMWGRAKTQCFMWVGLLCEAHQTAGLGPLSGGPQYAFRRRSHHRRVEPASRVS
jgi:hypothetical protein